MNLIFSKVLVKAIFMELSFVHREGRLAIAFDESAKNGFEMAQLCCETLSDFQRLDNIGCYELGRFPLESVNLVPWPKGWRYVAKTPPAAFEYRSSRSLANSLSLLRLPKDGATRFGYVIR